LAEPTQLDDAAFKSGLDYLEKRDSDLASIISKIGPPPFWRREPGFPTLVHIILEQQVSLASARAAFDRLRFAASPLTPQTFLTLDDVALKDIGFSRQKTAYCRSLAQAIIEGRLDLTSLESMDDSTARAVLIKMKGIGAWTAENYLLMAMLRADAWPCSDLALMSAAQKIKQLPELPTADDMDELAEPWRPWRAVAARVLWHYYLNGGKSS
jgi:DNA-3-methyladenine glycosylase II